jgi:hypothetical protein
MALHFMVHSVPLAVRLITNFAGESVCLTADNVQNEEKFYLSSQITGVKNAVPLHVDIPCTSGRGSF